MTLAEFLIEYREEVAYGLPTQPSAARTVVRKSVATVVDSLRRNVSSKVEEF